MKKFFSLVVLFFVITTYGAVTVNVNGSNYSIPQTNERGWGTAVTSWIQAISSNTLQPIGGSFTLTNDVDFGPNFGLKTSYLLSRNSNPSTAGLLRLNVTDSIGWRNNANDGNLLLGVNGSNQLTFNGSTLLSSGNIVNADISASAAIDASKIANGSVSNAEFQALDGVSGTIATTTGTQALTNKDIDGGTASNSNRITVPKNTLTNLQALTRKQGTLVYDTTSNKPYYDDGSNLRVIGSGSGGTGNLIEDGDAEAGTSNFVEGSYSAATRPAGTFTASSGSGTFAISTSTSSPIFGNTSFLLTKSSGASRQGRAIERTINIDSGYRTKMLKTRIDYTIVSGSFVAGTNGTSPTDSSLIWYVGQYNGSTWTYTEPSTFKMFSNSTTNSDWVEGEFQVNSDTTQLKLIGFISESANSAWVVKAEVGFRLSTYLAGTTVTDWVSYTYTGFTSSNGVMNSKWRRVGDTMEVVQSMEWSNTAGAFSGNFGIPSGYTIDTAKLPLSSVAVDRTIVGRGTALDSGLFIYDVMVTYRDTTTVNIWSLDVNTVGYGRNTIFSNTAPFTIAASDNISIRYSVPIVGWSSSTQQSDGYDARKIGFRAEKSTAGTTTGSWQGITFTSGQVSYDDVVGWDGTGTYTIRKSDRYRITVKALGNSTGAATNYLSVGYRVDSGTDIAVNTGVSSSGSYATGNGSDVIDLRAGQTVQMRVLTNNDTTLNSLVFSIQKDGASPTISATEKTVATYKTLSSTTITSGTALKFTTSVEDSHARYNTSTGAYLIESAGTYEFTISGINAGAATDLKMFNGVTDLGVIGSLASGTGRQSVTIQYPFNAGDSITFVPQASNSATDTVGWLMVKKIK